MANRYIQTHTPDGNELDNKILPEGTIAVRGNQLIVGDGVTEASELEPSGDPAWAGGGVSFVIASGTVDLSVDGSTELTYASGFDGTNFIPFGFSLEALNDTDTFTENASQTAVNVQFKGISLIDVVDAANWVYMDASNAPSFDTTVYRVIFPGTSASTTYNSFGNFIYTGSGAIATDKISFVVPAEAPSSTQFRVTVKILGIKTS